jgi:hypothetical protein
MLENTRSMSENSPHRSENENSRNALLQQVEAVETEMARMWALQENERLRLCSKINSLSPFDQLPAEIKTEIFYNALSPLTDLYDSEVRVVDPFFLGKICHGWRDFVWSTPIFWTILCLQLSTDNYETQVVLLRDWLSRTGEYPISFCLDTEVFLETRNRSPIEVLTLFASVSARWKEIEISFPDLQACFDTISTAEKSLPLLTTATVQLDATEEELNLLMAPQLSELRLYSPLLRKVLAPWHQLQEFSASECYVDEIRFFFHNAPHIVRCAFKDIESSILESSLDQELFHRPLLLEHLQYLALHFDNINVESTWILKQVRLPSLREVFLHSPAYTPHCQEAVLSQITNSFQSSPLLEKFTLSGMMMSDHDLIQASKNIPSVKDLSLDFSSHPRAIGKLLTEEFLQRLYFPHAGILLPNLRSFTYRGPTSLNEHMHLFRDVLVYRFRKCALRAAEVDSEQTNVAQIKAVSVTSSSAFVVSPYIQEELNSLMQAGLEFSLTFESTSVG